MPSPRPEIAALSSCYHGGPNYTEFARLGIDPKDAIDFSSNSNPYPFNLDFKLDDVIIDHYPDSDSTELRRALAAQNQVGLDNIVVGAGSMEIIRLIAQAYFSRGDEVIIVKPTFGEYETACLVAGAEVVEFWAQEAAGFCLNIERAVQAVKHLKPKAIFICNPNNPTGRHVSRKAIEELLVAADHGLVVLDEAYLAFTDNPWNSVDLLSYGNLIILRSMTKDFALAGLRLGYCLASADIIENLNKVKPPWNVNAVAQKAGLQATRDGAYLRRSERLVKKNRDYLMNEFIPLGFKIVPTSTNFFLMKVGKAGEFRSALLRDRIVVRDCTSFGLPEYVRIAPRTMPECRELVRAVKGLKWRLDTTFCRR
ncbi:histidinol-phosphate aminotransferase [Dehalogenimonas formicexedens]|uniref:Aminotransferase n=1 Tax=Dehalogenimonas formicexedens TaxID=1839801 RepID=A0A1P8F705_9CHLR|nr:histidinol-phosphate transaminase [Dehalogenimonas formicexedens]APV44240.1 histidinol-phosphate aminotransferase [Dehalogenimonas formicexedens]APV44267.1 histidinol-phosphate aminotransferase [Dehalogenimonas formicexedens]